LHIDKNSIWFKYSISWSSSLR